MSRISIGLLAFSVIVVSVAAQPAVQGEIGVRVDGFGSAIALLGDVDGDGVRDLAVGDPGTHPTGGSAFVFSGASGAQRAHLRGRAEGPRFGVSVASAGDLDRDGFDDVIVGSGQAPGTESDFPGYARIFSGAKGSLLRELESPCARTQPTSGSDRFGESVASAGDIDRDGVPDVFVGAPSAVWPDAPFVTGCVFAFSGADGKLLRQFDGASAFPLSRNSLSFGACVASLPDLDADGVRDIAVGAPWDVPAKRGRDGRKQTIPGPRGSVHVLSSATGKVIARITDDPERGKIGEALAVLGDVDGDGVADFATSSSDAWVRVISGKTQRVLHATRELGPGGEIEGFGDSLAAAGDVDRDGVIDVAVGCGGLFDTGNDYHYAALFSGADGKLLRAYLTEKQMVIVGGSPGDLDGDGVPEVVLGLPKLGEVAVLSGKQDEKHVARKDWKVLHRLVPDRSR